MFTAELFIIAKIWKQTKYPSIDKWIKMIKDVVHIYNKIVLSHKKERNLAICYNMDDPKGTMLSEISQPKKDKNYRTSFICGIKNKINQQIKQKQIHR